MKISYLNILFIPYSILNLPDVNKLNIGSFIEKPVPNSL
jgi:hypothetical protein